MSNLMKTQATYQAVSCRTSLGANGVPDKFVKEDLQQPYWVKISFEGGSKEVNNKSWKLQA
jgi:hypothetical protein